MPNPPSEYWTNQGFTTFQEEPAAGQFARLIGLDNMIWGSEYPHPDSVYPGDNPGCVGQSGCQRPAKIVRDNAMDLYSVGRGK